MCTRAQTPALLKGLIFGPTGCAMSPTHTRKGGRLYRYYPTRAALADALQRLRAAGIGVDGASDHGVSEALYLSPDGNGLELCWDRPQQQWPRTLEGHLDMHTRPRRALPALRNGCVGRSAKKKALAFVAAIRERKNAPRGPNQRM